MSGSELVLSAEAERFERRLTDEIGALRAELHRESGALRAELHQGVAALRLEMHDGFAAIRKEMATLHADTLKWSFLFWIGQVATITALFSFMLRSSGH